MQGKITEDRTYHDQLIEEVLGFTHVRGRSVLVVGCGRGKECELLRLAGANEIIGIDCGKNVGEQYQDPAIKYTKGFAENLPFEESRFNVVVCCATLEHVQDPEKALREMVRVTASRGIIYCYVAPLWNSPFGHHKKHIFPDDPWLHVRFDTAEKIMDYLGARASAVVNTVPLEGHIKYMMDTKYFNKFSLRQYKAVLGSILSLDVSPLHISAPIEYRFEKLLTPELNKELMEYEEAELFTAALKIVLRKY